MRKQGGDKTCGIRNYGQIRGVVLSQDRRIYIDVDKLAGWLHAIASRAHLGEAATDRQSKIAGGCDLAHERRRSSTKATPQPQGVGFVENAFTGDGGGNRSIHSLSQSHEVGAGVDGSEPEVKQRAAAGVDPFASLLDKFPLSRWSWRCRLRAERLQVIALQISVMQIGVMQINVMTEEVVLRGNLDHHRPGRGPARDLASAADGRVDLRSMFRAQLGLGHGPRDGELVHVVELERPSGVAPNPTSEHKHGD